MVTLFCAQAQVGLGMPAGSPCPPLPTPSPHVPSAHSPLWQGHTGIWVHSSWTHAVKDLSLVEFYLSGFWLSVLIVTQITCLFPRVKWPSHTKCTSPSSRRLLPLMGGGSCEEFTPALFWASGLKKENHSLQHEQLQSLLNRWGGCSGLNWSLTWAFYKWIYKVDFLTCNSAQWPRFKWMPWVEEFTIIFWHNHHSLPYRVNSDFKCSLINKS